MLTMPGRRDTKKPSSQKDITLQQAFKRRLVQARDHREEIELLLTLCSEETIQRKHIG